MSDIQNIGVFVSKIAEESEQINALLYEIAQKLNSSAELSDALLRDSRRPEGKLLLLNLSKAQMKAVQAMQFVSAAEEKAKEWVGKHVVSAPSGGGGVNFSTLFSGEGPDGTPVPDSQEAYDLLSAYMMSHNYGINDYGIYSQDPEWRILHRAAFPKSDIPPMDRETAFRQLSQYMSDHRYAISDYATYSQDPIWQELHQNAFPEAFGSSSRPNANTSSSGYNSIVRELDGKNVDFRSLEFIGLYRSSEEIVKRLGGGDKTKGSCSSLAFAYIGNRAGYDVLDFRDGESRHFFAMNSSIDKIAHLPGVTSKIINGFDDIDCANTLLSTMQEGKEYYLATGEHAAIVRKNGDRYEYLEMQSTWNNGWKTLNDRVLHHRFGCETTQEQALPNFLIDSDSLLTNQEFLDILGYLNTAENEQRKGGGGHVR